MNLYNAFVSWVNSPFRTDKKMHSTGSRMIRVFWAIFRYGFLISLCLILIYPLLYMLSMSFRTIDDVYDPSIVWLPRHFTINNIVSTAKAMQYGKALINTVLICVVSSILEVMSTSLVGYGFARFKFKGRRILFAIVILTIVIPPTTTIIPTYIQYRYFDFLYIGRLIGLITGTPLTKNLLNTVFTMYLPALFAIGIRSGLFIYIFRQFFAGLPKELEDAACVDGCGPVRTFLKVMIPSSGAVYLTNTIFSIVWYWNDYFYSGMYFPNGNTISLALSNLKATFGSAADAYAIIVNMQAGCLLAILPPLIFYIVFQRYFSESIARTGIVG